MGGACCCCRKRINQGHSRVRFFLFRFVIFFAMCNTNWTCARLFVWLQHFSRDFSTSSKSNRRLMNPVWTSSDSDHSIVLPADKEWKPSIAKKMFMPRRADVFVTIISLPNGSCEEIILRGDEGNGGIRSAKWTRVRMRLELHDTDTVPELHLDINEQQSIVLPLNYLSEVDALDKEVVMGTMQDSSTSLSKVQPDCLSNMPEFYPVRNVQTSHEHKRHHHDL